MVKSGKWLLNKFTSLILLSGFMLYIIAISVFLRVKDVAYLENKYLLDNDSYRALRQSEIIAAAGKLPERDMMRWSL